MIIFDTDILTLSQKPDSEVGAIIRERIRELQEHDPPMTTIITYEEQTRGWFAVMAKAKTVAMQIAAYRRLEQHVLFFRRINILPFDESAGENPEHLRSLRLRVGTMDLRIAAIALAFNATLISRNLSDFSRIPGLRVEDWTRA